MVSNFNGRALRLNADLEADTVYEQDQTTLVEDFGYENSGDS